MGKLDKTIERVNFELAGAIFTFTLYVHLFIVGVKQNQQYVLVLRTGEVGRKAMLCF